MDNNPNTNLLVFACMLGFSIILGSIIPDVDHIPAAFSTLSEGRIAHTIMFGVAIFFSGCCLAYIGGLYIKLVLEKFLKKN